jgi:AcrR family transcriptional regulator
MRDIADAVGVTPPAIYLHFKDKDELFFAVCERPFKTFSQKIRDSLKDSQDPLERVRRMGRGYVQFGLEFPEQYRVMMLTKTEFDPMEHPLEDMYGMQVFYQLVSATKECIDDGLFRPMEPMTGAIVLWGAVHGLTSLLINHKKFPWPDRDEMIDAVIESTMKGLQP